MPDQIQIRWSAGDGQLYESSMDALRQYDMEPSINGAVALKGNYTQEAVDQVIAVVQELNLDAKLSMDVSYSDAESAPRFIGSVNIKGAFTRAMVDKVVVVGKELGLEPAIILTATWGKNVEVPQLQLFPPVFRQPQEQQEKEA